MWPPGPHPLALLSIIETKLSGVIGDSPMSCRVVTTFSHTVEMLDTQTGYTRHHHLTLFYRSWHIWGSPLASCEIGTH